MSDVLICLYDYEECEHIGLVPEDKVKSVEESHELFKAFSKHFYGIEPKDCDDHFNSKCEMCDTYSDGFSKFMEKKFRDGKIDYQFRDCKTLFLCMR